MIFKLCLVILTIYMLPIASNAEETYLNYLRSRIRSAWNQPKIEGRKRSAIIKFKLHKDGSVSDLRVFRKSGQPNFDQSALKAVQLHSPFRALPHGTPEQVEIEMSFDTQENETAIPVQIQSPQESATKTESSQPDTQPQTESTPLEK